MHPNDRDDLSDDQKVAAGMVRTQLERFTSSDARCRGLELPEGLLLRYNLSSSLYFYLRTGIKDGKVVTTVFASDSPHERQKTLVGEVETPMFAPQADADHIERVHRLLYAWVDFVRDESDERQDFSTFEVRSSFN